MPSVMQKIVAIPAVGGLHDRIGRPGRRHEDQGGVRAGLADGLGDRIEDRHRAIERRLAALARGHAGDDVRAVRHARPPRGSHPRAR